MFCNCIQSSIVTCRQKCLVPNSGSADGLMAKTALQILGGKNELCLSYYFREKALM